MGQRKKPERVNGYEKLRNVIADKDRRIDMLEDDARTSNDAYKEAKKRVDELECSNAVHKGRMEHAERVALEYRNKLVGYRMAVLDMHQHPKTDPREFDEQGEITDGRQLMYPCRHYGVSPLATAISRDSWRTAI